jgi:hypothetical protein
MWQGGCSLIRCAMKAWPERGPDAPRPCSRVPGTVVNRSVGQAAELETLEISHPIGSMSVFVQKEDNLSPGGMPVFGSWLSYAQLVASWTEQSTCQLRMMDILLMLSRHYYI